MSPSHILEAVNGVERGDRRPAINSEVSHEKNSTSLLVRAQKFVNYLGVWPGSLVDGRRLLSAYWRTVSAQLAHHGSFGTVGVYISGTTPIRVSFRGLRAFVRPGSDDVAILVGNHEPEVIRWFRPRRGELVVDVGAHIGTYTLRAARAGARVISFEPNPETARVLRENLRLNGFLDVDVRQLALGAEQGVAELHIPPTYIGRSSILRSGPSDQKHVIRVERLDDELGQLLTPIDWLKIDVEGFELQVLGGAIKTLHRTRKIILEVDRASREATGELLRVHGFVKAAQVFQPTQDYWLLQNSLLT